MAAGAGDMPDGAGNSGADRLGADGWQAQDRVHSPEADAQAATVALGALAGVLQSCCLCQMTGEQTQGV